MLIDQLRQSADSVVNRRYEIVFIFDVTQGNPNGDPDGDNAPRVDIETGHGLMTDVCLKRKIRNFITLTRSNQPPFDIYVKERGILANEQKKAYLALGIDEGSNKTNFDARAWMCKNFYDVRTFGAVMTTGKAEVESDESKKGAKEKGARQWNCGQVRGPVQVSFSRSIDPVFSQSHAITRVALTNASDVKQGAAVGEDGEEKAASGQMGRKYTVAYGLYRSHIFLAPFLAKDTRFTNGDFAVLLEALQNLFEFDRSASRGEMNVRGIYVFEHASELGNAPSHKLFDLIQIAEQPTARTFDPARVTAPSSGTEVSPGVTLHHLV